MRPLNRDLERLVRESRTGSHKTREERRSILMPAANHLHDGGHGLMRAASPAGKHIAYLVLRWRAESAPTTAGNRAVHLR